MRGAITHVERIVGGPFDTNCYVVSNGADAVVIDADGDPHGLLEHIDSGELRVHGVIATHAHHDHVAAAGAIVARHEASFHLHSADRSLLRRANLYRFALLGRAGIDVPEPDAELVDSARLRFGGLSLDVAHTPGHTPGSVCLSVGTHLFSGDTLDSAGPGRSDLPGGDGAALARSVAWIAGRYPSHTTIWPGHGAPVSLEDALAGAGARTVGRQP